MTEKVEAARKSKRDLLTGAQLPLEGLGVDDGCLTYNGMHWDCMSSSEQLRVAAAIVRRLKPECGFVLMDRLEQMDADTLHAFGDWVRSEGLQVIATRVSTGDECQIIIENGEVAPSGQYEGAHIQPPAAVPLRDWRKEGGFGQ